MQSVAFEPGGERVASAGMDRAVRLWNLRDGTGQVLGQNLARNANEISFHPQGKRLGVGGSRPLILDLESRRTVFLQGFRSGAGALRFSGDGRRIATTHHDGALLMWDAATGRRYWRTTVLTSSPAEIHTHRGWILLDPAARPAEARGQAWRRAIEERAWNVGMEGSTLCLLTHEGAVELWDMASDRRILEERIPEPGPAIWPLPGGCLSVAGTKARLHRASGGRRELAEEATSASWVRGEVFVGSGRSLLVFDEAGTYRATLPTREKGIRAIGPAGDWLAIGYQSGSIDLLPRHPVPTRSPVTLRDTPPSPVERLIEGPGATVIAGFANGFIGIWDSGGGNLLYSRHLNGHASYLLLQNRTLFAASELGQHLVLDLSVLSLDYCALLRRVWDKVPVGWEGGRPVVRPPPEEHRCER